MYTIGQHPCKILFLIKEHFSNYSETLRTVLQLFLNCLFAVFQDKCSCSVPEHVQELMKNILRTLKCLEIFFNSAKTNIEHFQSFQLEQMFLNCSWILSSTEEHFKKALIRTDVLELFLNPFKNKGGTC